MNTYPLTFIVLLQKTPNQNLRPKNKTPSGGEPEGTGAVRRDVQAEETLFLGGMRGFDFRPCVHYLFFTGFAVFSKCVCGSQFAGPHEVG